MMGLRGNERNQSLMVVLDDVVLMFLIFSLSLYFFFILSFHFLIFFFPFFFFPLHSSLVLFFVLPELPFVQFLP